ncbi:MULTISPECIES: TM2 domain-containing protein [unclassified Mammaliicoccus]|uniref:TM2 domain-containing protein n=1 Tax=unclassified Mammaliicoccus TaxID=2803851 RepID=UPI001EFC013D|nr:MULTISPECIES: TM2 domain-containing protein [unclassified Mammaliicoccus]
MNLEEKTYIESQVANKGKKTGIAYILLILLGGFGAHRFYLEKIGSAVGLLLLTLLTGWMTFFIPSLIWIIVDACLIPGYINENNEKIRREATNEIKTIRGK